MSHEQAVVYIRTSTNEQNLGLEAQQSACEEFCRREGLEVVSMFVEQESGKKTDRAELAAALAACKQNDAALVVKKIDRLTRAGIYHLEQILKSNVEVIALDAGRGCSRFVMSVLAAVSQNEREAISERTRSALQALKAKGVVLGRPVSDKSLEDLMKGCGVCSANADQWVLERKSLFVPLLAGAGSLNEAARTLNASGVATRRGGKWTHKSVGNVKKRLMALGF